MRVGREGEAGDEGLVAGGRGRHKAGDGKAGQLVCGLGSVRWCVFRSAPTSVVSTSLPLTFPRAED